MKGNESIETAKSDRGAVLLRELQDLVDSFPEYRRKEVIRTIRIVFTRLNTGNQTRHSADACETENHQRSTSRETTGRTDLNT